MKGKRQAGEAARHFGQRVAPIRRIGGLVEATETAVPGAAEARRVPRDVAHGDRAVGVLQDRRALGVFTGIDLHVGELGQILRERVVELKATLLIELHERDTRDRLAHGINLNERVTAHGALGFAIGVAE
jgi:hypothetical protein